jgi:hypothetical protein
MYRGSRLASLLTTFSLAWLAGCGGGSKSNDVKLDCGREDQGCICSAYENGDPPATSLTCSSQAFPGTLCCAEAAWPSGWPSTICKCALRSDGSTPTSCDDEETFLESGLRPVSDCSLSAMPTAPDNTNTGVSSVTGTFSTTSEVSSGGSVTRPLSLIQDGNTVSGEYIPSADPYGTIDAHVEGSDVVGDWIQGGARGPIRFTFSSDGSSFTGTWDYAGGSGRYSWNGTRTSTEPTKLLPNPTNSTGGCQANSDCGSCEWCELSSGTCHTRLTCN